MRETAVQVMGYFGGAVAGLTLDWCAWSAVLLLTGQPLLSQGVGKGAGAVLAFSLYRRVFKGDKVRQQVFPPPSHGQARRFLQSVLAGWCVSMCLFSICTYLSGQQHPVMCKVVTDGMTFVLNWFVMKHYVFPIHAQEPITPIHAQERITPIHAQERITPIHAQERITPIHAQERITPIHAQERITPIHGRE